MQWPLPNFVFCCDPCRPIVLQWLLLGTNVLWWPSPVPVSCGDPHRPQGFAMNITNPIVLWWPSLPTLPSRWPSSVPAPSGWPSPACVFQWPSPISLSCSDPHRPQYLLVVLTGPTVFQWPSPTPISSGGPHRPHYLLVALTGPTVFQWPSPTPVSSAGTSHAPLFSSEPYWPQCFVVTLISHSFFYSPIAGSPEASSLFMSLLYSEGMKKKQFVHLTRLWTI